MPLHYCSASGCGNRISYLTTKPAECPKCHSPIGDALKGIAAAVIPAPTYQPKSQEDMAPLARPARSDRSTPVTRKVASQADRLRTARAANGLPPLSQEDVEDLEDDEEYDDLPYDPVAARRLARQLAASIDPSTIHAGSETGEIEKVRFRDWVGTGLPNS